MIRRELKPGAVFRYKDSQQIRYVPTALGEMHNETPRQFSEKNPLPSYNPDWTGVVILLWEPDAVKPEWGEVCP